MAEENQEGKAPAEAAKKKKLVKGRHASAIKRHRQSLKKLARNRVVRAGLHMVTRKIRQAVQAKDRVLADSTLRNAMSLYHKAASRGVVHHRNASRHIARLSALVSRIGA